MLSLQMRYLGKELFFMVSPPVHVTDPGAVNQSEPHFRADFFEVPICIFIEKPMIVRVPDLFVGIVQPMRCRSNSQLSHGMSTE